MAAPKEKKDLWFGVLPGLAALTIIYAAFMAGRWTLDSTKPVLDVVTSRTCDFLDVDEADDYVIAFCQDGTVWSVYPSEAAVTETLQIQPVSW